MYVVCIGWSVRVHQTGNEMESPVNRSRAPGNKESEREDGNTGRTKGREIGSREEQRLTEDGRSGARFEGREGGGEGHMDVIPVRQEAVVRQISRTATRQKNISRER